MENEKKLQKDLLAVLRRADEDYGFIYDGDNILVGVSGGKDSLVLLKLLSLYQKFPNKHFTFKACHIDFGFPFVDFTPVKEFCESLHIDYIDYKATEVSQILDMHRKEDGLLPCSICSRMRKAVINKCANELGFKKVAFAHHMDDAIVTLFMNMTYGGRVNTFEPKMYLERSGITFIRPLLYAREKMIEKYTSLLSLPVTKNSCGNDKRTQRAVFKEFLEDYYHQHPDAYDNFASMLYNPESFQLFFNDLGKHMPSGLIIQKVYTAKEAFAIGSIYEASDRAIKEDYQSLYDYYLFKKHGHPSAYLKVKEDSQKKEIKICSLVYEKDTAKDDLLTFIKLFENERASHIVPLNILVETDSNSPLFKELGYIESEEGSLSKTLRKSTYR